MISVLDLSFLNVTITLLFSAPAWVKWTKWVYTRYVPDTLCCQASHSLLKQQEPKVCFWNKSHRVKNPSHLSQSHRFTSTRAGSRSWHYREPCNWEGKINMFITLILVNKEIRWRALITLINYNTACRRHKGKGCAVMTNRFLWAVSSSENMKMLHQMDEHENILLDEFTGLAIIAAASWPAATTAAVQSAV